MNKFVIFLVKTAKVVLRPFFPFKVYGDRAFPNKKSLIVGNHVSGWDAVMFMRNTKNIIPVVYKAEFDNNAFLHWVFSGLDCVPVKRGEVDMTATKGILRLLKNDKAICLFPEGTRNPTVDCLQEFHTGAALFAIKTHAPIRPFYIWDKTKPFHKNYMIFGDEFTLDEFYDQPISHETLEAATAVIKNKVEELRLKLNAMLEEKGVKRRKRTKKEIAKLNAYYEQQRLLAEQQAADQAELQEEEQSSQEVEQSVDSTTIDEPQPSKDDKTTNED